MNAPHISKPVLHFFRWIVRGWFQFHFTSVLALNTKPFTQAAETGPLIIYCNHSSWWDPMIGVLLAAKFLPRRTHFAPIDEASLGKNRMLGKIGLFPLDIHSARAGKQFLQIAGNILSRQGVLWMTPQGRFADTRESILAFKPGLASLVSRLGECTLIPLAVEYPFWNERRPRALVHFGEPIVVSYRVSKPALTRRLEEALQQTMDELRTQSLTRDPANFTRLPLWRKATGV